MIPAGAVGLAGSAGAVGLAGSAGAVGLAGSAGLVGLAVLGVVVGLALTVIVDRVPARERLLPLRFHCPRCPGARDLLAELAVAEQAAAEQAATAEAREPETDGRAVTDRAPEQQGAESADAAPPADERAGGHARRPTPGPEEQPAPGPEEHPGLPVGALLVPRRPCPGCGARLGARSWALPWITAVLFVGAGIVVEPAALPAHLVLVATLAAMTVIDLELRIIPNRLVYPATAAALALLALAAALTGDPARLGRALIGAALAWAFLFILWVVSPASMGFGDVRLAFLLGLFLGWSSLVGVLVGIFLGFALAAVVGVGLIVTGAAGRKTQVPFGPFLAAGALVAIAAGDGLTSWWTG